MTTLYFPHLSCSATTTTWCEIQTQAKGATAFDTISCVDGGRSTKGNSMESYRGTHSLQSFSPQSAQWYTGLFFGKYFFIPLLLSLPVYFTAYDYGRWFTVTCINFSMVAVSVNLPCWEFALWKKAADEGSAAADSREHLDSRLVFYSASIIICILALVLWLPHYCLFSCEIINSPLQFFSHAFIAH